MIAVMSDTLSAHLARLQHRVRRLEEGKLLFRQGDTVRDLHLVTTGEVHLVRNNRDGLALTLQRACAGALLAEASLHAAAYHCDAIAAEASEVLAIAKPDMLAALARDPGLAAALQAHLAREVQRARQRAEILSLRTVAERLDAWLAANDGTLPPKGDWKLVAAETGISREALYRELAKRR